MHPDLAPQEQPTSTHKQSFFGSTKHLVFLTVAIFLFSVITASVSPVIAVVAFAMACLGFVVLIMRSNAYLIDRRVKTQRESYNLAKAGNNTAQIIRKTTSWKQVFVMNILWPGIFLSMLLQTTKPHSSGRYVHLFLFFLSVSSIYIFCALRYRHNRNAKVSPSKFDYSKTAAIYSVFFGASGSFYGYWLTYKGVEISEKLISVLMGLLTGLALWTLTLKLFPKLLNPDQSKTGIPQADRM